MVIAAGGCVPTIGDAMPRLAIIAPARTSSTGAAYTASISAAGRSTRPSPALSTTPSSPRHWRRLCSPLSRSRPATTPRSSSGAWPWNGHATRPNVPNGVIAPSSLRIASSRVDSKANGSSGCASSNRRSASLPVVRSAGLVSSVSPNVRPCSRSSRRSRTCLARAHHHRTGPEGTAPHLARGGHYRRAPR